MVCIQICFYYHIIFYVLLILIEQYNYLNKFDKHKNYPVYH